MGFITTAAVGVILIAIGIINMTGNISLIHSYHRSRVSADNIKPFGMLVGLGTLLIGIACVIFGVMLLLTELTGSPVYTLIGSVQLIAFIIAGLVISFYAMKKYNGGIF